MPLPNLLIIGAQKCGTSWLHRVLKRSNIFHGSDQKELNFFNRDNFDEPESIKAYESCFEDPDGNAAYLYESTPHYFRLPEDGVDIAERIHRTLGAVPLVLLLRDPVERYLSAYRHNAIKRRLRYVPAIEKIEVGHRMLSLGFYDRILDHFSRRFPDIQVHLYERVRSDSMGLVRDISSGLGVEMDLTPGELNLQVNVNSRKAEREGFGPLPELSVEARKALREIYSPTVERLRDRLDRDLSEWGNFL